MKSKRYLVEKRTPDGKLDLSPPQPVELQITEAKIIKRWFNSHPGAHTAPSIPDIKKWFEKGSGFKLREITWR